MGTRTGYFNRIPEKQRFQVYQQGLYAAPSPEITEKEIEATHSCHIIALMGRKLSFRLDKKDFKGKLPHSLSNQTIHANRRLNKKEMAEAMKALPIEKNINPFWKKIAQIKDQKNTHYEFITLQANIF